MKLFFKKLGFYILFLLVFFLLILQCLSYLNQRLLRRYKIDPVVNTIIIGDSHEQWGIDDSQLPGTINLAQAAEPFMFSYAKLKIILENHPNIKRVLLGCSYHNLSKYYDRRMYAPGAYNLSRRYFSLLPARLQAQLLWNNRNHCLSLLRDIIITDIYNVSVVEKGFSFIGGFKNGLTDTSLNDEIVKKRIEEQFYDNGKVQKFSAINILYFNKMIELCRHMNVDIIIVNTPLAPGYLNAVPAEFKEKYYSVINANKVQLIEFTNINLTASCFVSDGEHLSPRGAIIAANFLKTVLGKQ